MGALLLFYSFFAAALAPTEHSFIVTSREPCVQIIADNVDFADLEDGTTRIKYRGTIQNTLRHTVYKVHMRSSVQDINYKHLQTYQSKICWMLRPGETVEFDVEFVYRGERRAEFVRSDILKVNHEPALKGGYA